MAIVSSSKKIIFLLTFREHLYSLFIISYSLTDSQLRRPYFLVYLSHPTLRNPPCVRLFLSFQLHRHVGEQRGLRSMHASPKGWREPGSKRGRKRWKRETNGEESARGKKLEGAAGVEDGIDPYQTTLRPTSTQG